MPPASIRSTSSGVPTHSVAARSSDTFWPPPLGLPTISIPSRGRPKPRARYGGYRYRDRASNFSERRLAEVQLRRITLPRTSVNHGLWFDTSWAVPDLGDAFPADPARP